MEEESIYQIIEKPSFARNSKVRADISDSNRSVGFKYIGDSLVSRNIFDTLFYEQGRISKYYYNQILEVLKSKDPTVKISDDRPKDLLEAIEKISRDNDSDVERFLQKYINDKIEKVLDRINMVTGLGTIKIYYGGKIPNGFLELNGQVIKKIDYPSFFKYLNISDDTYQLEDWQGLFVRMHDTSANIDRQSNREIGSVQEDSIGYINGKIGGNNRRMLIHRDDMGDNSGIFKINKYSDWGIVTTPPDTFNTFLEVSIDLEAGDIDPITKGSETTPKNIAQKYVVQVKTIQEIAMI